MTNFYDFRKIIDTLETARIYAGAEMERLCNDHQHIDACVFQSVRDSIAQNIQLLKSYEYCKAESEDGVGMTEELDFIQSKQIVGKLISVDVLDKIRAEIEQIEINGHIRDVECFRAGINTALNIINKYKVESEDKE